MKEQSYRSSHGVLVHSYPNPALHSFCLCLYVRGGCMYEAEGENGITHLLEHTVFRNLNHRLGGTLYTRLDRLGLEFNAATYKEFVRFTLTGAPRHFEEAARILCAVFSPLTLPMEEYRTEKRRIRAEIRESGDKYTLETFADGFVWKDRPLKNLITGTASTVEAIGRTALDAYRRRFFSPENMFFYLTGNVTEEDARLLCRLCEEYPLESAPLRDNRAPLPEDFGHRNCRIEVKNSQEHYLRFSFDFSIAPEESAALNLLYDVLFCGDSSKLFWELSEKSGLIYSYDARLERYRNGGVLNFSFECKPREILCCAEKVVGILKSLKEGLHDELSLVRPAYTDNGPMLLDSAEELNWTRAYNGHILEEYYPSEEERCRAYAAVENAHVDALSRRIFTPDGLVLCVKTEKKKLDREALKKIMQKL